MDLRPMLATLADAPLKQKGLVYEPKYDGIRAIVEIAPAAKGARVGIWSRNGNEKTAQFPAIVRALEAAGRGLDARVVLDGEIVALDEHGRPAGFQRLQGRMHLIGASAVQRAEQAQPATFIAFDILRDAKTDLTRLPLTERRKRLEALFDQIFRLKAETTQAKENADTTRAKENAETTGRKGKPKKGKPKKGKPSTASASPNQSRSFRLQAEGAEDKTIRISEQVADDATAMHARAVKEHWEGLIAKDAASTYQPGRRSPAWRKIKLQQEQEFVVGGWTEPRQSRQHFGALLLGVHENGGLKYAGHTGTGFDQKELARLSKLLKARATKTSPFSDTIHTNEPAHWVRPDLVAQVRFTEWTADNKLRHPVYLGLRDDKGAQEVVRESAVAESSALRRKLQETKPKAASAPSRPHVASALPAPVASALPAPVASALPAPVASALPAPVASALPAPVASALPAPVASALPAPVASALPAPVASALPAPVASAFRRKDLDAVINQLRALEDARKDGELTLPNGDKVKVTNLAKLFWPSLKITKGDLLRYYVEVSPYVLPCVEDRPLVMKRFPNGVGGKAFYQQRSREERPPAGVRIETLEDSTDPIAEPDARRLIGGSLTTLLYMTQIAAISQDPWFSRVQQPLDMDHCAIDLDPTDGATFDKVLDVARWVRDELASLGVTGFPKTSGASGLHIYIPLPPGTSYESGQLFCQIVATVVASRHRKVATVERAVARRPRGTIYVDFLQNILGKTLATAYSARASDYAGVSTPLTWKEVDGKVDPHDFTIRTAPARFRKVGDVWEGLRTTTPADLESVFEKYKP